MQSRIIKDYFCEAHNGIKVGILFLQRAKTITIDKTS
jgi:hypothetical protein